MKKTVSASNDFIAKSKYLWGQIGDIKFTAIDNFITKAQNSSHPTGIVLLLNLLV